MHSSVVTATELHLAGSSLNLTICVRVSKKSHFTQSMSKPSNDKMHNNKYDADI